MKISLNLEKYDIKSMEDILIVSKNTKERCDLLEQCCSLVLKKAEMCGDEFTSVNYEKIINSLHSLTQKVNHARTELTELNESVIQLTQKINDIWGN